MPIAAAQLVANVVVTGAAQARADLVGTSMSADAVAARFAALKAASANTGVAFSSVGAASSTMSGAVARSAGSMSMLEGNARLASGIMGVLKVALIGVGIGGLILAGVGVKSIEMAGNFQQATNTLITSAGLSKNSIDAVRQGILKMSVDTATSWQDLNKGMFNVESALHLGAGGLLVLKAAAEGAKAENSDLAQTTDVLTTAMVNYHIPASKAVDVMNSLIATVAAGKLHMNDLTGSLRNVLPVAAAFHIDLGQVEGALATMANAGDRGTMAGTHLAMMFKMLSAPVGAAKKEMAAMGLDSVKLAETMRTSIPGALKMIQDAVAAHFKPGSVEYQRAILAILGGSKSGVAGLEIMNQGLKVLGKNTSDAAAALHKGSKDVENWGIIQHNANFQLEAAKNGVEALMIKIGTALLPVITQLLGNLTPLIGRFSDWLTKSGALDSIIGALKTTISTVGNVIGTLITTITNVVGWFQKHEAAAAALKTVLIMVAGAIAGVLVVAFVSWAIAAGAAAIATLAATWPILLVGAAIAGLIALFIHFYQTNAGFKKFIDDMVQGFKVLAAIIGTGIHKAVDMFTNDVEKMRIAHEQKVVAMRIASDTNLAKMSQQSIAHLETQRVGILKKLDETHDPAKRKELEYQLRMTDIQIKNQQIRLGLVEADKAKQLAKQKELHDQMLESQKWFGQRFLDMVGQWGGHVFSAVGTWTHNVLSTIGEWFGHIMSAIGTFVHNFLSTIGEWWGHVFSAVGTWTHNVLTTIKNWIGDVFSAIGTFVHNVLSKIGEWKDQTIAKMGQLKDQAIQKAADIINGIMNWFTKLPGKAGDAIKTMASTIKDKLTSLASDAIQWGANIVANIASGITGAIGNFIGGAMNAVGNFISSHLPHSPAKLGPLRDLDRQSVMISEMIAAGLIAGMPRIQAAMGTLLKPVSIGITASAPGLSAAYASRSSLGTTTIVVQPPDLILDGVRLSRGLMPHITNAIRYNVSSGFGR